MDYACMGVAYLFANAIFQNESAVDLQSEYHNDH